MHLPPSRAMILSHFFFFNDTATTEIYTLSLHDALPIWEKYVVVDKRYLRPAEVEFLQADWSKVRETLRWEPTVDFNELVRIMVEADLKEVETKLSGGAAAVAVTSQH